MLPLNKVVIRVLTDTCDTVVVVEREYIEYEIRNKNQNIYEENHIYFQGVAQASDWLWKWNHQKEKYECRRLLEKLNFFDTIRPFLIREIIPHNCVSFEYGTHTRMCGMWNNKILEIARSLKYCQKCY